MEDSSSERSPLAPHLPTIREAGIANFSAESWNGIMAPANMPPPLVQRIASVLAAMAKDGEVKNAMAKVGATLVADDPESFKKKIAGELEQWTELVKELEKN